MLESIKKQLKHSGKLVMLTLSAVAFTGCLHKKGIERGEFPWRENGFVYVDITKIESYDGVHHVRDLKHLGNRLAIDLNGDGIPDVYSVDGKSSQYPNISN